MSNFKKIVSAFFLFLIIVSCKKEGKTTCTGGSGGNITIVVFPKHHGKAVRPYTAYLMFNNKNAPAAISSYDLTKVADTTEDHVELTNLKCGDYYIYMNAYDTLRKLEVKGGIPYTLSESATGEILIDIPVTE